MNAMKYRGDINNSMQQLNHESMSEIGELRRSIYGHNIYKRIQNT